MIYIYSYVSKPQAYLYVPSASEHTIDTLHSLMGNIKFKWFIDGAGLRWITFSKANLERAIEVLPDRFGELHVHKEYNNRQTCTTSCQNAKRKKCECSCLGKAHKGGEGLWLNVTGDLLVQDEKTTIHYTYSPNWK